MPIALRIKIESSGLMRYLRRVRRGLQVASLDPIVGQVAGKARKGVAEASPKRWFGQLKRSWTIEKHQPAGRTILNTYRARNGGLIIAFLELGTANEGTGFIRPRTKKFLYVPLTRRAAGGWNSSLVRGRDYVLKRRVRGIKPRRIVASYRPTARALASRALREHVRNVIRN